MSESLSIINATIFDGVSDELSEGAVHVVDVASRRSRTPSRPTRF